MARDLALECAWRQRMRAYEQSGMKIREFCRQEGLVDHQFTRAAVRELAPHPDALLGQRSSDSRPDSRRLCELAH